MHTGWPRRRIPDATMSHHAFYKDTGRLRIDVSNMMNMNSNDSLVKLRDGILELLSKMRPPSGVAIAQQPAAAKLEDVPEGDPDVRGGGALQEEQRVQRTNGYDSDEETTERVCEKEPPPVAVRAVGGVAGSMGGPAPMEGVVKAEADVKPEVRLWAVPATVAAAGLRADAVPAAAPAAPVAGAAGAAALDQGAGGASISNVAAAPGVAGGPMPAPAPTPAAPMVGVVAPMPMQDQAKPFAGPAAVHSVPVGQAPVPDGAPASAGGGAAADARPWPNA